MQMTRKQALLFTSTMCFTMVFIMTIYNMWLNGLLFQMPMKEAIGGFFVALILALVIDIFCVGPFVQKVVLKSLPKTISIPKKIIVMSVSMVTCMALAMSVYGLVNAMIHGGITNESIFASYMSIFLKNYIFALPLQMLIIGPVIRKGFQKFILTSNVKGA